MAAILQELLGFSGQTKIGEVTLDASFSQAHGLEADVTDHPVEDGSDISDNHRAKPKIVQIVGQVSDSPIQTGFPLQTAISSVGSLIAGDDPVQAAWDTFNRYFDDSELITISTSLREYQKCMIVSLSVPRDAKTGKVLRFTLNVKQIRVVTTASTTLIPVADTTTGKKGEEGKKKSRGNKQAKDASDQQSQSFAAKALDKGASFFSGLGL